MQTVELLPKQKEPATSQPTWSLPHRIVASGASSSNFSRELRNLTFNVTSLRF